MLAAKQCPNQEGEILWEIGKSFGNHGTISDRKQILAVSPMQERPRAPYLGDSSG